MKPFITSNNVASLFDDTRNIRVTVFDSTARVNMEVSWIQQDVEKVRVAGLDGCATTILKQFYFMHKFHLRSENYWHDAKSTNAGALH